MVISVAIPTKNEEKNLLKILPYFEKNNIMVVISDDLSTDKTVEVAKHYGAYVPYHDKKLGMGRSWKEAVIIAWYSFDSDIVITMDADHDPTVIPNLLACSSLANEKGFDVVVGNEEGEWQLARQVTAVLCNRILGIEVTHPTCGYILFTKSVLDRIPWKQVKSKGDMFHVELLWWAKKTGSTIGECKIPEQEGRRRYGIRRVIRWLWEFFRVVRLRFLWFFRWNY